jgi:hypothetical protein
MEDVFKLLQCDENGLSPEEAQRRLELFGPNKLESEEQNPFLQVSQFFLYPSPHQSVCGSVLMFAFAVLEFHVESPVLGHGGCCPRRYRPFQR